MKREGNVRTFRVLAGLLASVLGACVGGENPGNVHDEPGATIDAPSGPGNAGSNGSPMDAGPTDGGPGVVTDGGPGVVTDGGAEDASIPPDAAPPIFAGELYPFLLPQSPLTQTVAGELDRIASVAWRSENVFAKVGDSITVSSNFFYCANDGEPTVDLNEYAALESTLSYFDSGDAHGVSPFDRVSSAAGLGWTTNTLLSGGLDEELDLLSPRFAVVLIGTNDRTQLSLDTYVDNLLTIVDAITEQGTIPILSTVPPQAALDVRDLNGMIRAAAQSRQVPLIDLYIELDLLPDQGLTYDGIHLSEHETSSCWFDNSGLACGSNVRNLLTLQALDRARRVVVEGESAPDVPELILYGDGSGQAPFKIPSLPFVDVRSTMGAHDTYREFGGCGVAGSAGDQLYEFTLDAPATVRVLAHGRSGASANVYILSGSSESSACVATGSPSVTAALLTGTHYIVIDGNESAAEGEYLLYVRTQ